MRLLVNPLVKFVLDNLIKDPLSALTGSALYLLYSSYTDVLLDYPLSDTQSDVAFAIGVVMLTVALTTMVNRRRAGVLSKRERTVPESVYNRQQQAQAHRFDQVVASLNTLNAAVAPVEGRMLRDFIKEQYNQNQLLQCRHREVADQSGFAYFETGPDGTLVFANKAYCALVGSTLADLLVSHGAHTIYSDDKERVVLEVTRAVNAGSSYITTYSIDRCGNRGDRVQLHANVVKNAYGAVLGWTGYMVKV